MPMASAEGLGFFAGVFFNLTHLFTTAQGVTSIVIASSMVLAPFAGNFVGCIFCGYCVEACPTDAITHGHGFEAASYNTSTLVKRKEDMLAPVPAGARPPVIAAEGASAH